MTKRPLIGVTGPERGGAAAWWFTSNALRRQGAVPVRFTPSRYHRLDEVQGLVFGGGADVDPALYGQVRREPFFPPRDQDDSVARYMGGLFFSPVVRTARLIAGKFTGSYVDAQRDKMELLLLKQAVEKRMPVLGICRGQQLINVFFGGSLHQLLTGFYVEEPELISVLPRKQITVEADSVLGAIVGQSEIRVNGLHRQGIDRVGAGLRVVARDMNGIIQAIEHVTLPFLVGVQWHPEYLPHVPEEQAIFRALVRCAADEALSKAPEWSEPHTKIGAA
jgi:putative glutamine amidotransferase